MKAKRAEEAVYKAVLAGELRIDIGTGEIWRLARRRGGRHGIRLITCVPTRAEKLLQSGYLMVRAMWDGQRHCALAHRLVWYALHGTIPDDKTVNHLNGVKSENRPSNLELATPSEQAIHARKVLGKVRQNGARNNNAKLSQKVVEVIRSRRLAGESLKSIAKDFGISDRTVSKVALGKRWTG